MSEWSLIIQRLKEHVLQIQRIQTHFKDTTMSSKQWHASYGQKPNNSKEQNDYVVLKSFEDSKVHMEPQLLIQAIRRPVQTILYLNISKIFLCKIQS